MNKLGNLCIVAIARDEEPFIREWIAYHALIGVDHFFIYDDGDKNLLRQLTRTTSKQVTVVPWFGQSEALPGRNRQTKAYWHSLKNGAENYRWVAFLDIDEFIVTRNSETLTELLSKYPNIDCMSLNWHVFGHNGYYDDPPGLITTSLTRRMRRPSANVKSIARPEVIVSIDSAHEFNLRSGARHLDGNGKTHRRKIYRGITAAAHINHYQCRSFCRWMKRVTRGDVNTDSQSELTDANRWRVNEQECLRQFVSKIALDKNELVDTFMLRYENPIRLRMEAIFPGELSVSELLAH